MSMPTSDGRVIARPTSWGVSKSSGGAVEFACDFQILHHIANDGSVDTSPDGESIVGYFYPIDKDGKAVVKTIEQIKAAFGWSGTSLKELNEGDWSQVEVQLVLGYEEYKGKPKLKVKWLNPRDYEGGSVGRGDAAVVAQFDSRFGAQLRALSGGKPAANPSREAMIMAWSKYNAKFPNTPKDEIEEGWRQAFSKFFPGRKQELLTVADWNGFVANNFEKKMPENPLSDTPIYDATTDPESPSFIPF